MIVIAIEIVSSTKDRPRSIGYCSHILLKATTKGDDVIGGGGFCEMRKKKVLVEF